MYCCRHPLFLILQMRQRSNLVTGVASSAAAVGVAALRSATKSAKVTSVSCPTLEITGKRDSKIARTTISSLKAQRSSMEPPPRPMMRTSKDPHADWHAQYFEQFPPQLHHLVPWSDREGYRHLESPADGRDNISNNGSTATGYYADTLSRNWGKRLLEPFLKQAFFCQFFLELFKLNAKRTNSIRFSLLNDDEWLPLGS